MANCLGLFAKYWQPGKVKTRLAEAIGEKQAARVYRAFVEVMAARLSQLCARKVLAHSPGDDFTSAAFSTPEFAGWTLVPQIEGDLGHRMASFFRTQLEAGSHCVVLLGTDSPNVPLDRLQRAFVELKTSQVVLGPTEDGGYYLAGVSGRVPPLFDDMPWSTPMLWQASISRLERAGIRYSTLDPWYDVDEIDDLARLVDDLKSTDDREVVLDNLLGFLVDVLPS